MPLTKRQLLITIRAAIDSEKTQQLSDFLLRGNTTSRYRSLVVLGVFQQKLAEAEALYNWLQSVPEGDLTALWDFLTAQREAAKAEFNPEKPVFHPGAELWDSVPGAAEFVEKWNAVFGKHEKLVVEKAPEGTGMGFPIVGPGHNCTPVVNLSPAMKAFFKASLEKVPAERIAELKQQLGPTYFNELFGSEAPAEKPAEAPAVIALPDNSAKAEAPANSDLNLAT